MEKKILPYHSVLVDYETFLVILIFEYHSQSLFGNSQFSDGFYVRLFYTWSKLCQFFVFLEKGLFEILCILSVCCPNLNVVICAILLH